MRRCTTVTQRCYFTIECGRKYSLWLLSKSHILSSINCICSFKVLHATCIRAYYTLYGCVLNFDTLVHISCIYMKQERKKRRKKNEAGTFTRDKLTFCRNWYCVGCLEATREMTALARLRFNHTGLQKKIAIFITGEMYFE